MAALQLLPPQVYSYPALEKLTVLTGHMGTVNTIALDATDRCAAAWVKEPDEELEVLLGRGGSPP